MTFIELDIQTHTSSSGESFDASLRKLRTSAKRRYNNLTASAKFDELKQEQTSLIGLVPDIRNKYYAKLPESMVENFAGKTITSIEEEIRSRVIEAIKFKVIDIHQGAKLAEAFEDKAASAISDYLQTKESKPAFKTLFKDALEAKNQDLDDFFSSELREFLKPPTKVEIKPIFVKSNPGPFVQQDIANNSPVELAARDEKELPQIHRVVVPQTPETAKRFKRIISGQILPVQEVPDVLGQTLPHPAVKIPNSTEDKKSAKEKSKTSRWEMAARGALAVIGLAAVGYWAISNYEYQSVSIDGYKGNVHVAAGNRPMPDAQPASVTAKVFGKFSLEHHAVSLEQHAISSETPIAREHLVSGLTSGKTVEGTKPEKRDVMLLGGVIDMTKPFSLTIGADTAVAAGINLKPGQEISYNIVPAVENGPDWSPEIQVGMGKPLENPNMTEVVRTSDGALALGGHSGIRLDNKSWFNFQWLQRPADSALLEGKTYKISQNGHELEMTILEAHDVPSSLIDAGGNGIGVGNDQDPYMKVREDQLGFSTRGDLLLYTCKFVGDSHDNRRMAMSQIVAVDGIRVDNFVASGASFADNSVAQGYFSSSEYSPSSKTNIAEAASRINGRFDNNVLSPGETFSFNELMGNYLDSGWNYNGKLGGGVCDVATLLWRSIEAYAAQNKLKIVNLGGGNYRVGDITVNKFDHPYYKGMPSDEVVVSFMNQDVNTDFTVTLDANSDKSLKLKIENMPNGEIVGQFIVLPVTTQGNH